MLIRGTVAIAATGQAIVFLCGSLAKLTFAVVPGGKDTAASFAHFLKDHATKVGTDSCTLPNNQSCVRQCSSIVGAALVEAANSRACHEWSRLPLLCSSQSNVVGESRYGGRKKSRSAPMAFTRLKHGARLMRSRSAQWFEGVVQVATTATTTTCGCNTAFACSVAGGSSAVSV